MIVCRYHWHWRLGSNDIHCVDHMLSQVLKLNAIISQCHDNIVKSKCATTYKCHIQIVDGSLIYLMACKDMS